MATISSKKKRKDEVIEEESDEESSTSEEEEEDEGSDSDVDPQLVTKVISSWANGLSLFVPSLVQPEVQPRVYTEVNESTGYNYICSHSRLSFNHLCSAQCLGLLYNKLLNFYNNYFYNHDNEHQSLL